MTQLLDLPEALAPLAAERRWLVWRWERTAKGKPTKVPYQAAAPDRKASSTNPTTWADYAVAARVVDEGRADGIGFALHESGVAAFDLDDCRDPETGTVAAWALDLVERAGSYVEVTVSGEGLRIIGRGDGPKIHRKQRIQGEAVGELETYRRAERYIVVTGQPLEESAAHLADLDALMDEVVARLDAERDAARRQEQEQQRRERAREQRAYGNTRRNGYAYHTELADLIRYGAPEGQRSEQFHHVVGWLKQLGWTVPEIEAELAAYPHGIAAKYQGRLRQEIERSWDRTDGPREGRHYSSGDWTQFENAAPRAEDIPPIALHWHGEADPNADRAWLVKNLVYERGRGLTAGQWGTGKTFGVLDLSASVMTGEPFAGRKVMRTGGVLFIAPEGAFEIPLRLRGLVEGKLRGVALARTAAAAEPVPLDALPFAWIEECPPLAKPGAVRRLIATAEAAAAAMRERFGVELVLVVLDTVAAGAGFEDENSAAETQRVMDAMGELSRATGAFVMGVDHFGKLVETGTRGSSAKEAGADVVLAMLATRTESGEVSNTRMAVRKVRGAPCGYEIPYVLEVVPVGEDRDGEPVTTCVIQWKVGAETKPQPAPAKERWPQSLRIFRTALSTALIEHGAMARPYGSSGPEVRVVKEAALRWEFLRSYPADGETEEKRVQAKRKAFVRALKTAIEKGLVAAREIGGVDHLWTVVEPDGRDG